MGRFKARSLILMFGLLKGPCYIGSTENPRAVESTRPTVTDWIGVSVCLLGMSIIMLGARQA